ncbi:MAG: hypothetical protein HQK81_12320 [Desulfovibrionaceae bacterium]|nr:hypothetical protein [Desulfovibrionaceae bacterium]MBF0514828.1 hypothetical protein [Desulfovibrionaceae bacterium]
MTPDVITRTIQGYFAPFSPCAQTAYANVPEDFPAPPWLSFYVLPGQTTVQEIPINGFGNGKRVGVVKIQIITAPGDGSQVGGALAGQVEALFRWRTLVSAAGEGLYFEEPYTSEDGPDSEGHYQHTVTAPFWCWTP